MAYSCQNIFHNSGRFDAFVELTFRPDSEAYKKFGRVLLGTFYYTRDERKTMERMLLETPVKHTDGYIKFRPSDIPKELSGDLKEDLDKKGILNSDIELIRSLNLPRTNRFTTEGEREIQNKLIVEFDTGGMSVDQMQVGYLRMRITTNGTLIKEEWQQYVGLESYHSPKRLEELQKSGKVPNGLDEKTIRYYHLDTKVQHADLTAEEMKEYEALQTARSKASAAILAAELKKSNENTKELAVHYKDNLNRIIWVTIGFDTEVLLPYKIPIWWNLERFLHIYLRHVKETVVGDRNARRKSLFKYSFKDVRRIVSAVIEQCYEEIEEHFRKGNTNNFRRQGRRAVYYDGVYYSFQIQPSGLIEMFTPEEDLDGEP